MKEYKGYIGSYTRKKSTGLRRFRFHPEGYLLEDFQEMEDPTYLAMDGQKKILYGSMRKGDHHGVFSLDLDTEKRQEVLVEKEATPCHVSVFSTYLLASNYHHGKVDLYRLQEGHVEKRLDSIAHEGSGPREDRQEASHIHFAMKSPHDEDILVCDLGSDQVYIYHVKEEKLIRKGSILLPMGTGPRHLLFSKTSPFVYIFSELTSEIFVLKKSEGSYHLKQVVSTLPEDFHGENTGAAIRFTPDEKFLYVSNRGHDSLTAFEVRTNHHLSFIDTYDAKGAHPRDFNITPDGAFLLVAHMNSHNLALFKIQKDSGKLHFLRNDLYSPEPVSIVFQE